MNSSIRFLSTTAYLPPRKVYNDVIAKKVDTSDKWIQEHTGIKTRYIADNSSAASDLAYNAAIEAIKQANITKDSIQMIIVATSTPDYLSFPATACVLQEKLDIEHCIAFDITAACTGFTFACSTAIDAINSGMVDTVLVVGTEIFSSIIDWTDRNTCILFGDGAGASILSSKFSGDSRIITRHLMTTSKEYACLIRESGGTANRDKKTNYPMLSSFVKMNGRKVYQIALKMLEDTVAKILEKSNLSIDDIDYLIPHQANLKMIQKGMDKLGIPLKKTIINIDRYANTSAASIPIALSEGIEKKKIQRGMNVLLIGFGAGLSCGGILLKW